MTTTEATLTSGVTFQKPIPILRIFDVAKAREFYCDFLRFKVTMEHRFEPGLPLYMAVERGELEFHLSEHHGDASPGSTTLIWTVGIAAYHAELTSKEYHYGRPALTTCLGAINWKSTILLEIASASARRGDSHVDFGHNLSSVRKFDPPFGYSL